MRCPTRRRTDSTRSRTCGCNRFIRLWRKLDLPADVVDDLVTSFLGVAPEQLTPANIDAACVAMLARLGNFEALLVRAVGLQARRARLDVALGLDARPDRAL